MQDALPGELENLSSGHAVQDVAPAAANFPAGHTWHEVALTEGLNSPDLQDLQALKDVSGIEEFEYLPTGHGSFGAGFSVTI